MLNVVNREKTGVATRMRVLDRGVVRHARESQMKGTIPMNGAVATFESKLQDSVRCLLQQIQKNDGEEHRQNERYSFFRTVTVRSDNQLSDYSALTREISQTSIGLLHEHPIRAREVHRMTIHLGNGYAVTVPIASIWCRPCGRGWYISGFRLLDRTTIGDSMRLPENLLGYFTQDIERLTEKRIYDPNIDKRCEERYHVTVPLTVTPLTPDLNPHGKCLTGVTCDISGLGISFFARTEIDSGLVSLEMRSLNGRLLLRAVMETLRCRPIGDYYMIAGKFISKRYFVIQSEEDLPTSDALPLAAGMTSP